MTNEELIAILASHQRHGTGMTRGSADTCACGARLYPAGPETDVDGTAVNIMERRDASMAQHQAHVIRSSGL